MSSYISSSNNRFYVAAEPAYGVVPAVQSRHRISAIRLKANQETVTGDRRDKTGSRTYAGVPAGSRRRTTFSLNTYMTAWGDTSQEPSHGPLISAAMGGGVQLSGGATVAAASGSEVTFGAPHGLSAGQAVAIGGEIRFVVSAPSPSTIQVNAPFQGTVVAGSIATPTATYRLASGLPSAALFDYWSPDTAVQRLLPGVAVDEFAIKVNGDFHEFEFSGGAADLLDNSTFTPGQAGLAEFPVEPDPAGFDYTIIPGHLGQAWVGILPEQCMTLTSAEIRLDNQIDFRDREFGCRQARAVVGGVRKVTSSFSVFAQDDVDTKALYEAARQMSPISVMLQLGNQPGQLFGVYLKSVMPEVPDFDDSETRLQWNFRKCRAQGVDDDEIMVAFA